MAWGFDDLFAAALAIEDAVAADPSLAVDLGGGALNVGDLASAAGTGFDYGDLTGGNVGGVFDPGVDLGGGSFFDPGDLTGGIMAQAPFDVGDLTGWNLGGDFSELGTAGIEMSDPGSMPIAQTYPQTDYPDQISRAYATKAKGATTSLLDSNPTTGWPEGLAKEIIKAGTGKGATELAKAAARALISALPDAASSVAGRLGSRPPEIPVIPLEHTIVPGVPSAVQVFNPGSPPPVYQAPAEAGALSRLFGPQGYDPFAEYRRTMQQNEPG